MADEDGATERLHSPSSIKLAGEGVEAIGGGCRYAWALRYLDRIREPEIPFDRIRDAREVGAGKWGYVIRRKGEWMPVTSGQRSKALGTRLHSYAEWWVLGIDSDDPMSRYFIAWSSLPGQILQSMLDHIPPRGSIAPGHTEVDCRYTDPATGVQWRGKVDVLDLPGKRRRRKRRRGDLPTWPGSHGGVWDFKTSRDIVAYAAVSDAIAEALELPDERRLAKDLQGALYALFYAELVPSETVPLRWVYGETQKARRCLPVVQPVAVEQARTTVAKASSIAQDVERYRTSDDAPANTLACDDYGGCWYRAEGHCRKPRNWGALRLALEARGQVFDRVAVVLQKDRRNGQGKRKVEVRTHEGRGGEGREDRKTRQARRRRR